MPYFFNIALYCAALAIPMAHAADTAAPQPATVTDAGARVPSLTYDSAFSGYQPFREQKLAPWREVNDEAHKAGGHIGIVGGAAAKKIDAPAVPHPPGHKK